MSNLIYLDHPSNTGKGQNLPAEITKHASKQTYYTFRLLVPGAHLQDAFRAYAYFRWVDDQLDCNSGTQLEKLTFLNRQRDLLNACYRKKPHTATCPEEQMLVDLIESDPEESSGLQFYLRNMMAVMAFDIQRKGHWISQAALTRYSHLLSTAVTELLFYFIDHNNQSPSGSERYQAVHGAHIAHMLRDLLEDIDLGYINLPAEILEAQQVSLSDVHSLPFRKWVLARVKLARQCFNTGRKYFDHVKSLRCRLAAFAYLARFEWMLQAIERDGYHLRRTYPERKRFSAACWMAWRVFKSVLNISINDNKEKLLVIHNECEE
jgi:phytoene/squalene synthetase